MSRLLRFTDEDLVVSVKVDTILDRKADNAANAGDSYRKKRRGVVHFESVDIADYRTVQRGVASAKAVFRGKF
jgi:hypothetical protein